MSPDTARLICAFLSDTAARSLTFGSARSFAAEFPVMFKTGTANQFQNIVALGATPRWTVAVWMGNFTGETVIGRTGSSLPAACARDTLVFLQGGAAPAFQPPEHWTEQAVCALSGMAPGPWCPNTAAEYVLAGSGQREVCTWHRQGALSVVYPAEYQSWFFTQERRGSLAYSDSPLEITSPRDGFVFLGASGEIPVEGTGGAEDTHRVEYDGDSFILEGRPFLFYLPQKPGEHVLTVHSGDETAAARFRVANHMP
jgi:penicillin-binding protein 1C